MLNDPTNQMPGSSSNPGQYPGSSSNPGYYPNFQAPFMNPEELALFSQWKLQQQQQQQFNQFTQSQQTSQAIPSQPNSDHGSYFDVNEVEVEEEDKTESEEEVVPTPTSKKSRAKTMAKKPKAKAKAKKGKGNEGDEEDVVPSRQPRTMWTQEEELLLSECYIEVSEDAKVGADQQKDTFWYKVLEVYNKEAKRLKYTTRTKNMLTGKWTPMNKDVKKFNTVVDETAIMSGEGDKDFMNRCHVLFRKITGYEFKHLSAWGFLKDKHKWKNPDSTLEPTSCQGQTACTGFLRANVRQTRPLVPVQTWHCFKKCWLNKSS